MKRVYDTPMCMHAAFANTFNLPAQPITEFGWRLGGNNHFLLLASYHILKTVGIKVYTYNFIG